MFIILSILELISAKPAQNAKFILATSEDDNSRGVEYQDGKYIVGNNPTMLTLSVENEKYYIKQTEGDRSYLMMNSSGLLITDVPTAWVIKKNKNFSESSGNNHYLLQSDTNDLCLTKENNFLRAVRCSVADENQMFFFLTAHDEDNEKKLSDILNGVPVVSLVKKAHKEDPKTAMENVIVLAIRPEEITTTKNYIVEEVDDDNKHKSHSKKSKGKGKHGQKSKSKNQEENEGEHEGEHENQNQPGQSGDGAPGNNGNETPGNKGNEAPGNEAPGTGNETPGNNGEGAPGKGGNGAPGKGGSGEKPLQSSAKPKNKHAKEGPHSPEVHGKKGPSKKKDKPLSELPPEESDDSGDGAGEDSDDEERDGSASDDSNDGGSNDSGVGDDESSGDPNAQSGYDDLPEDVKPTAGQSPSKSKPKSKPVKKAASKKAPKSKQKPKQKKPSTGKKPKANNSRSPSQQPYQGNQPQLQQPYQGGQGGQQQPYQGGQGNQMQQPQSGAYGEAPCNPCPQGVNGPQEQGMPLASWGPGGYGAQQPQAGDIQSSSLHDPKQNNLQAGLDASGKYIDTYLKDLVNRLGVEAAKEVPCDLDCLKEKQQQQESARQQVLAGAPGSNAPTEDEMNDILKGEGSSGGELNPSQNYSSPNTANLLHSENNLGMSGLSPLSWRWGR